MIKYKKNSPENNGQKMIIDTNVYSMANKGHAGATNLLKNSTIILIPTIVLAELKAGFLGGGQNHKNSRIFDRFMVDSRVDTINIGYDTVPFYAELAVFAKKSGRVLANNDIWIAALALENKMPLATFDKDFSVFESFLGKDLIILE